MGQFPGLDVFRKVLKPFKGDQPVRFPGFPVLCERCASRYWVIWPPDSRSRTQIFTDENRASPLFHSSSIQLIYITSNILLHRGKLICNLELSVVKHTSVAMFTVL